MRRANARFLCVSCESDSPRPASDNRSCEPGRPLPGRRAAPPRRPLFPASRRLLSRLGRPVSPPSLFLRAHRSRLPPRPWLSARLSPGVAHGAGAAGLGGVGVWRAVLGWPQAVRGEAPRCLLQSVSPSPQPRPPPPPPLPLLQSIKKIYQPFSSKGRKMPPTMLHPSHCAGDPEAKWSMLECAASPARSGPPQRPVGTP